MLASVRNLFSPMNDNKLMVGIIMIFLNIGSKYIDFGFSKTQEQALRNGLAKEMLIFAIVFAGTRDIVIAILMTASFVALSDYIFNENSKFCIIPHVLTKIKKNINTKEDDDANITDKDEKAALELLRKLELKRRKNQQIDFVNFMISKKTLSMGSI
jgi:hypothetical protein